MRRRDWIEWVRAVECEGDVVAFALEVLAEKLQAEPSLLRYRELEQRDRLNAARNREATYLVRLFGVFESALRDAWAEHYGETTHPKATDLLDAFASRCRIPSDHRVNAHLVRTYRNNVVHDYAEQAEPVELAAARRYLCRFLSHLPEDW